jgi:hypothetical protein
MRIPLILLTPLLLAGCIKDSASYYIDGNGQTLTVRAEQEYFWHKNVTLRLIAARLPECQRLLVLGKARAADLELELFASGDDVYTLRAGDQVWQVETRGCTQLEAPAQASGQPLGAFRFDAVSKKMVFEKLAASAAAG